MPRAPLVGLPADSKLIGLHRYQAVGEKYVRGVIDGAGAHPAADSLDVAAACRCASCSSNWTACSSPAPTATSSRIITPRARATRATCTIPARDATTLSLVPLAIEMRVPVLAVCRGMQEVNVALGGSLHQKVHDVAGPGRPPRRPVGDRWTYNMDRATAWTLERIAGQASPAPPTAMVNSLHGQGIDKLGRGLVVEAIAPDGLVEAVRLDSDQTFLLAVQWHPEWKVTENPFYLGIFQAFAAACRARAAQRD